MLRNYFKIAWRNIMRHKAYSGINILGLAIGIAACLLILQYVAFELSYEDFQVNKDRIYRVQQGRRELVYKQSWSRTGNSCLRHWIDGHAFSSHRPICSGRAWMAERISVY